MADLKSDIDNLRDYQSIRPVDCPKVPKSLLPSDAKGSEPSDDHRNEPKVMSLGPYHHGNPKLVRGERIKLKLAERVFELLRRSKVVRPGEAVVDQLYSTISGKVDELRKCYDWESMENYSNEEFSVMMMVDGCALLWYMFYACYEGEHYPENFRIRYQDVSHLHRDALLLENQLPYQLLLDLRNMLPGYDRSGWMALCLDFFGMFEEEAKAEACSFPQKMREFCSSPFPTIGQVINCCIPQIIKRRRRPNPDVESETNPDVESQTDPDVESQTNPDEESQTDPDEESQTIPDVESETKPKQPQPCHLLDLYLRHCLGPPRRYNLKDIGGMGRLGDVKEQVMASFRNVKELMSAGIRIKPSPTRYLRDISFTSNVITGCLRLPIITIDNSTKDMFFNLIAWEWSFNRGHDFISYLRFLDSLIDHADDVKELQSAGVLQNNLGTHEEVAEFFNTVSAKFEPNFHAYRDVRVKIRKHLKSHRNSKLKRWMTQCLDTYFGSPWTIIAWVGAALALFFTAVQTYFSAFSH